MGDCIYSHILLCQCLCFTQGKTRPTHMSEKCKFLSSLALLLNGDNSCTAVYVNQTEKTVLIARNEPISSQDRRYFDQFFRLLRMYSNICFDKEKAAVLSDARKSLYCLIYEYNVKKIIKRFTSPKRVIVDRLKKLIGSDTNQIPFINELRLNRQQYCGKPAITEKLFIKKNRTDEEYVQDLFQKIKEFLFAYEQLIENQTSPTDQQLKVAIGVAVKLYESRLAHFILRSIDQENEDSVYYFEKISAHCRSINLILKCLYHRKNDLGQIYQQITWKLVSAVEREQVLNITPKKAFEVLFNDLSLSSSDASEHSSCDDLYCQHLTRMSVHDENARISMHAHAEILLVNYLLENRINETYGSGDVEIGISKMPCLLCSYYINELNEKYHRCFFPSQLSNGKIYGKWLLRDSEDPSIIQAIDAKLIKKLHKAIEKLCLQSRRSDPKKSGDSDIMSTSIEEDGFDLEFDESLEEEIASISFQKNL